MGMLRPRSPMFDHVVAPDGASALPLVASFEQHRQPNYGLSYLLAARQLIEQAEASTVAPVAMPVAYLQRHAFELGVKSLLLPAYWIEEARQYQAALDADPIAPRQPEIEVPQEHQLRKLVGELDRELTRSGYTLPSMLKDVADKLADLEEGDATRLRYPIGARGEPSLLRPLVLKVGEIQNELEEVFEKCLDTGDPESFAWDVGETAFQAWVQINQRLEGLWICQYRPGEADRRIDQHLERYPEYRVKERIEPTRPNVVVIYELKSGDYRMR